jgi:hypothetical protein
MEAGKRPNEETPYFPELHHFLLLFLIWLSSAFSIHYTQESGGEIIPPPP